MLGFSLQYEIGYSNVLTMLDLGGLPLHAEDRSADDTLVIAGGPGSQNPELLAPFIDLFVIGDGEPSLPVVCDLWAEMKGDPSLSRAEKLARIAGAVDWAYVPRFYEMVYAEDGTIAEIRRTRDDVPAAIKPCVIQGLDDIPLPVAPIVPFIETAHDRIAIEIMRGCPWQCRFCQSTTIKRPLRYRTVETIVNAAMESYRNTGHDEISLLSLSTSDYPKFEELVTRMSEVFTPLGVKISLPSLRITDTLKKIPALLQEGRRGGLTLAPEVARDDMREQIRKPIDNRDLYEGAAEAFRRGWRKVKLYFLCGLPGERPADLDGIVEMAETIARIGKDVTGRFADVTASVSNFVPKPHTPYQWNGMMDRDYFHWAHRYMRKQVKIRSVTLKCHDIETEGPGSTPGPSTSTPRSGGAPSPTSGSTSPSTARGPGRSRKSSPGTTSTSRRAATTWPRSKAAPSSSSPRWRERSERPPSNDRKAEERSMATSTEIDKQSIVEALARAGANRPCPRCGNLEFTLLSGYEHVPIAKKLGGTLTVTRDVVPSILTVCERCGYLSAHALGALGLLPPEENDPS